MERRLKAYELGPAEEAAPGLTVASGSAPRHRFAMSVRERRVVLAVADLVIGAAACYVAFILLKHPHLRDLQPYEPVAIGGIWVIALLTADGYAFQIPSNRNESAIAVIKALPMAALFTVLVFFIHPYVLTRSVIAVALALGALGMVLFRVTAARLLLHESLATRVILLADSGPSAEVVSALRAARFEYRVVDTLILRDGPADSEGIVDEVRQRVEATDAEEVVVTSNEMRHVPGLVEDCLTHNVRLVTAGDLVERYIGRVPVDTVDSHWYLGLPNSDVWRRPYAAARRLSDLVLAVLAGIPFLVLFPFLAVAIKLDSPGPVILVQRRVGEGGKVFDLLKLRTMSKDAEAAGIQFTSAGDPRVTRVGRFLRTTRLDEFPQLLNIVRGHMSFIGPRPERPELFADLEARIPHFRSRLLVRPGVTGWAQINAGYASTLPEMTQKLEYDLYYIKNRSFRLDLQILFRTLSTVISRRGR
jgi:exopolysaccharide biosynthesis polyprenyl glycosylphosphotransferase